jgi:hypothetical protein
VEVRAVALRLAIEANRHLGWGEQLDVAERFEGWLYEALPAVPVTAQTIIDATAARFGVDVDQLVGQSRVRSLVHPRHVAMFVVRRRLGLSFLEIGRVFHRDHTSVQNAVNRIEHLTAVDATVRGETEALLQHQPTTITNKGDTMSENNNQGEI